MKTDDSDFLRGLRFNPLPRMAIAKFFILNNLYTNPSYDFIARYQT
jgi:hypothetical protein